MKSALNAPHLHDETAAYAWVEERVWPEGPVCPRCKGQDRIGALTGKSTRIGVYKCYGCRKPFTVKVGTVFESSHIKMHVWLQAMFLMSSSKKGISSNQLHRTLGITLKSAWFLSHRIREAMREVGMAPMGGAGRIVEADETYFGNNDEVTTRTKKGKPGLASKRVVLALVERGGEVRSFHVQESTKTVVGMIVKEHVEKDSKLHTDESRLYAGMGEHFADHQTVVHSKGQYAKGPKGPERIHTNSAEGYFGIFKRGMRGIYQHCSERHLHRYLAEFDFRYNNRVKLGVNDEARTVQAVRGVVGKRLTYRTTRVG